MQNIKLYTKGEEIANAITHSLGALLAIAAAVLLIVISIYLLIAGTYTPFALTVLRPGIGWWIFG